MVVATAKPDVGLGRIEAVVREELSRIAGQGVLEEERLRTLNNTEAGMVRALERVGGFGGKADYLNEYHVFTGDPGWVEEDLARYRRVTTPGLSRAAIALGGDPAVALSVVPGGRGDLAAPERSG
jgi:zinc protease